MTQYSSFLRVLSEAHCCSVDLASYVLLHTLIRRPGHLQQAYILGLQWYCKSLLLLAN